MTRKFELPTVAAGEQDLLRTLQQAPLLGFTAPLLTQAQTRLIRLDEINEENHQAYRHALANVYASLDPTNPVRLLYLLDGSPSGVDLYFGVTSDVAGADVHEAMINLRGALEGHLPGINFGKEIPQDVCEDLFERWQQTTHQGVMLGAPTAQKDEQSSEEQSFQSIDRLVRALQSGSRTDTLSTSRWQLAVISQPLKREQIRAQLDAAYALSSQLAGLVRTSVQASGNTSRQKSISTGISEAKGSNEGTSKSWGKNEGASETKNWGSSSGKNSSSSSSSSNSGESQTKNVGTNEGYSNNTGTSYTRSDSENHSLSDTEGSTVGVTQEISNKRAQHLMDYLDKQLIARLQRGLTKGLFHSAVYLTADNKSTYKRLKNTVRATFQGSETTLSPLEIHDLPPAAHGRLLQLPTLEKQAQDTQELLFHSLHAGPHNSLGSLFTADELAIVASLPERELQGIRRRKTVDFIVDIPDTAQENALDLGEVIDRGRRYPNNRVRISKADLNKHTFVTGVTGAGKTNTCLNLLLESELPFLVIEPAKTEYRELAPKLDGLSYYRPNGDEHQSLRLNPFALLRKAQGIKSHAGFMKNVFAAVFPLEASMPMMIEAAILAAYEEKGWDIDENEFLLDGNPFDPITRAWPTMSDMIRQLDRLIPEYGLGKELEEKYRGSLVSRLRSLTDGTLGRVLDVPQSLDFKALLQRRVVIELEELQGGEEKALVMALLLGSLNEAIRDLHQQNPDFRQLTLVEEAHRLLSRPEPGDKAAAMAVESFADMLAEVRKYGAGLIIADQIPAKLIPDVIKNTHTKIVHRLFAEDDRRAMGESMMMDDEQRAFLPNLATGEAIVFCGGWHGAAHAKIRNDRAQTDNRRDFDLQGFGIRQLWQERSRYYPQFCCLNWLSSAQDDPNVFADFVRDTRQAQNQLLHLLAADDKTRNRIEQGFLRIKAWYAKWGAMATSRQASHAQQSDVVRDAFPSALIAAAWFALMLDANPRPHTQVKDMPSLRATREDQVAASHACEILLNLFSEAKTLDDFKAMLKTKKKGAAGADFDAFCITLSKFKNF